MIFNPILQTTIAAQMLHIKKSQKTNTLIIQTLSNTLHYEYVYNWLKQTWFHSFSNMQHYLLQDPTINSVNNRDISNNKRQQVCSHFTDVQNIRSH